MAQQGLEYPKQDLDLTNFLDQELKDLATATKNVIAPQPWTVKKVNGLSSAFFSPLVIHGEKWDQLFPYRLLVIDVTNQNNIVQGGNPSVKFTATKGTGSALIEYENFGNQWIFQLPISPQQLNIQDQFSINTVATLRGVLEEHNGVKFKSITAQGTMGIWPNRGNIVNPPSSPQPLESIFGGTIESFGNLKNQIKNVIDTVTTNHPASKPKTSRPEDGSLPGLATDTGWFNALKLQQFLEQYAEAKKNPKNAGWRLVFDIPKQNQSFIVTPNQFNWQQNANKPMEVTYSMQLKAWRRVDLTQKPSAVKIEVQAISPGIIQRIMDTIFAARKATSAAISLIGAVTSDVEAPLNALRQTSLFIKDLAGAVITAADLPFQQQRDFKNAINDFFKTISINSLNGSESTDPSIIQAIKDLQDSSKFKEGLGFKAIEDDQLGRASAHAQSIDPAYNVFESPESNFSLMDQVPVNSLTLNNAQQNAIDNSIIDARNISVDDLKQFKKTIQSLAQLLANNFGAGDAFVSQIYGLPAPIYRVTPMTVDDYELLKSLYDVMQAYDLLTATTQIDDNNKQTNMDYVAGLASTAGIEFNTSASKVLAPVPFGLTIEAIAARYLGDPQRWLEIVTLNDLKDPYIDENGFQRDLLSNASGRQITISSAENLYLGQRVLLQSSTQMPIARSILEIDKLSDTSYLITLDGSPTLDNFIVADKAYLQAYLPGTVNSQQKIFIPSDEPVPDDPSIVIPSVASKDPLSGLSKVDWLLTDSGDLAVNSFGDLRYSYGMTNIIQALKIKFGTMSGTVLLHPEFGLGIRPGSINSTIKVEDLYQQINAMIQDDPRFSGVSNLQILMDGPKLSINVGVTLAGVNGVFPLTFKLTS